MRSHLATRSGETVCINYARQPVLTASLAEVTCHRCHHGLASIHEEESKAAFGRQMFRRNRDAAYRVGLGEIWDFVVGHGDEITDELLRNIVGALAIWLVESGYPERRDRLRPVP